MYLVVFSKQASADKALLKSAKLDKKAMALLDMLRISPRKTPPPYETLVGDLAGYYSRRINVKHRLVYSISDEPTERDGRRYDGIVKVARMWTHYDGIR